MPFVGPQGKKENARAQEIAMEALNYGSYASGTTDAEGAPDLDYDTLCEICCVTMAPDDRTVELKCGHRFHLSCVVASYRQQVAGSKGSKVKQCQYCRTPFKYLPYTGGAPILGLHDPAHVQAFLKQNMAAPDWASLEPNRHQLYVTGGKYRYRQGVYRSASSKMVSLVLDGDPSGAPIRTTKGNVLLVLNSPTPGVDAPAPTPAPTPVVATAGELPPADEVADQAIPMS